MDEVASYNKERWEELAKTGVEYSRPMLDFTPESARKFLDPYQILQDLAGKDVLCLAGGGGQQSAAFALLGARVTVFDLCETQLERDREAAKHYSLDIRTIQGDMRDLSCFPDHSFDIVWHGHSINFVPDVAPVFDEVARVLRPGGVYFVHTWNPYAQGSGNQYWTGEAYRFVTPYGPGEMLDDPTWTIEGFDGQLHDIHGPREFRHTLGGIVNGLISRNLNILGIWEDGQGDPNAEPGTWSHFSAFFPPWLAIWSRYG